MLLATAFLIIALVIILVSAELFTNGIEWLGHRLNVSEGVVGSVFAAVGTAMPETLIPFVSVAFFNSRHGEEVGIGAIAGAPFMLSTLTLALCGFTIWSYAKRGRRDNVVNANSTIITRDFAFFILSYSIAIATSIFHLPHEIRAFLAVGLLLIYGVYIYKTFKHEGEVGAAPEHLHFAKILQDKPERLTVIIPQVVAGILGIIGGAYLFVNFVEKLAVGLGAPAVLLSLILAPIATELPEKINSFLWSRSGKDTLALGNITGALVFQSCIPVAFGMAFTDWHLDNGTTLTGIVALLCCSTFWWLMKANKLKPQHLMMGSIAYALTIGLLLFLGLRD